VHYTGDVRQRRRSWESRLFGHAEHRWRSALGNTIVASAKPQ